VVILMNEEEILKRITGLLEQGCTMLAQHHDCGAPLFRYKGEILCPVCSFGTEMRMDTQANEAETSSSKPAGAAKDAPDSERNRDHAREMLSSAMPIINQAKESQEGEQARLQGPERNTTTSGQESMELTTINRPEINALLREVLLYELKGLSDNIKKEQDLSRLRAMLDCIEAALRILSILNEDA
jgi:UPF0148 protein